MSGGHFDYQQYRLNDIREGIKELVESNDSTDKNDFGDMIGNQYPEDVINSFKETMLLLEQASILTQRIDWLVSGDDGILSFRKRLNDELSKVEGGNDLLSKISLENIKKPKL